LILLDALNIHSPKARERKDSYAVKVVTDAARVTVPKHRADVRPSPAPSPDAGQLPETERNLHGALTDFDASPDIENLRKPKIVPDEPAPKAEPHGFGRAYHVWSFPTASGASSYAPKDVKQ